MSVIHLGRLKLSVEWIGPKQIRKAKDLMRWMEAQDRIAELEAEVIALRGMLEDAQIETDMEKAYRKDLQEKAEKEVQEP